MLVKFGPGKILDETPLQTTFIRPAATSATTASRNFSASIAKIIQFFISSFGSNLKKIKGIFHTKKIGEL